MDDNDIDDFVVHMSEDRGECDIALLFDARWIHGMEPFEYVGRALETAGPSFEGPWQQYGALGGTGDGPDPLDFIHQHLVAARPSDLPDMAEELIVATLGGLSEVKLEQGLVALRRHSAFLGHLDVTGPSEIRSNIMS